MATSQLEKIRLDRWLWSARFFKTRSLAITAIKGGKVSVNDQHAKPAREITIGDTLTIRQGHDLKTVLVRALSSQRGPATIAQQLYEETGESIERRNREKQLRSFAGSHRDRGSGRPTKRQRRQIHRFIRSGE